jgi:hypothetical protein
MPIGAALQSTDSQLSPSSSKKNKSAILSSHTHSKLSTLNPSSNFILRIKMHLSLKQTNKQTNKQTQDLAMKLFRNTTLIFILGLSFVTQAQANTITLTANGQWNEFNVDDFSSASQGVEWINLSDSNSATFGSALTYQFTIAHGFEGFINVVDAGFAGDRFEIFNNSQSIGITSDTTSSSDYSNNFADNLNNLHFSKATFSLNEGTYNITGTLFSTLQPFNATNGAIKLDVTPVPLPGTLGLLSCSLFILTVMRRRA